MARLPTIAERHRLLQASRGLSLAESARETQHATSTAEKQLASARIKLGARTTAHAIAIAIRQGLI